MPRESSRYIPVDELIPLVGIEQVAAYYGVTLPAIRRVGEEIRTRCFLNCGREQETGDRALAINTAHPSKQWRCHQYGCGKGGNLISLCDYLKPGSHMDGRPRGERFKEIARDLQAIVEGTPPPATTPTQPALSHTESSKPSATLQRNVPLARSDNERARALVDLDRKFITDPAEMSPPAAAYFRQRPFLSSEVCQKWRCGYLSRDAGGDRSGGTMRGKIVYPLLSERGEVLTWFGRDPQFETKHRDWLAQGQSGREPDKFHFVKGFQRGLELFGQQASRLHEHGRLEIIRQVGILVVEGPNDVIALDALGVPAVALCSNTISKAQAEKLARWSHQLAEGTVTLLLDCDEPGISGAKQAMWELAQHCRVRLGCTPETDGGRFRGRQPESLTVDEWQTLRERLT